MDQITNWLNRSCFQLNRNKIVGRIFTKTKCNIVLNITNSGQNISIVPQFKYLGIIIDSYLSFKAQIKKVYNRVKFSLADFNIYIACNILEMHNLQRANRIPHPTRTAIK